MVARDEILNRVRTALRARSGEERERASRVAYEAIPRTYRQSGTLPEADRVALFEDRLRHYDARPIHVAREMADEIAEILRSRAKTKLVVAAGFSNDWLPAGFEFRRDDGLSKTELDGYEGAVTSCTLGIAVTGTVVLESSPAQGRRATALVPDYHLCVLRRDDIIETVPEAIRRLEPIKNRPLTFFSGPSATVDIEMTRIQGVHGPRTLDILII